MNRTNPTSARRWLALGLVLAAGSGCGSEDDTGRLDQGASARAHSPDGASVRIYFADRVERTAPGTRVSVLADAERIGLGVRRKVVVAIQDGAFRGMAGQMERGDLRAED